MRNPNDLSNDGRRERARVRQKELGLRKTDLARAHVQLHPVFGEEAVSLVATLTRESWALSGRPIPSYGRDETPYRFTARHEPP